MVGDGGDGTGTKVRGATEPAPYRRRAVPNLGTGLQSGAKRFPSRASRGPACSDRDGIATRGQPFERNTHRTRKVV